MADYSGRKVKYGLGKETTRGTGATATYWVRWETADFFDTATTVLNQSSIGVLDKSSGAEIVSAQSKGQIAGKVTDQAIGLILFGAFGAHSVATHASESVVYDHTFTESQLNAAQSLTIYRVDPNNSFQYVNGMVDTFELDVKAGDFVRHSTSFQAFPGTTPSAQTPTFVAENEFKAKNVTAKMATTVSGLTGATAIPVNSFKLTMNKNVDPYWVTGTNSPSDIFATNVEITGEFVLRYTDNTYFTARFSNTKQAVLLNVTNSDVTIGSAANPALVLTLPACYLTDYKVDQGQDGMVTQTVSFTATYDIGTASAISAVLTNTVATY